MTTPREMANLKEKVLWHLLNEERVSDNELARRLGIRSGIVNEVRYANSIPSYNDMKAAQVRSDPNYETETHEELARRHGCSGHLIRTLKRKDGLIKPRPPKKPEEPSWRSVYLNNWGLS